MTPALAWNTAVSFVTNTNWQTYSGESTMGHLVQMAGLAVQNFVSAAVGMAVAVALVRGFARHRTNELGNFWVDLTRGTLRILLPISILAAIVLIAGGAIQNFHLNDQVVTTLGGTQQTIPGGPVASQEAIKDARHQRRRLLQRQLLAPVREPDRVDELVRDLPAPGRSASRCRAPSAAWWTARSRATRSPRSSAILAALSVTFMMLFQLQHHGTVPTATGAAMEGVEQRFGVADSAVFADATTLTSTGADRLGARLLHQPGRHDGDVQHANG